MSIHATTCFIKYVRGLSQLIERERKIKEGFLEKRAFETRFFLWCLRWILQNTDFSIKMGKGFEITWQAAV